LGEALPQKSPIIIEEVRKKVEKEKERFEEAIRSQPANLNIRLDYRKFLAKYALLDEYYEQSLFIADLFIEEGKYEAARLELERLLRLFPRAEKVRRKLIELYSILGDEEKEFQQSQKLATLLILNDKGSEALELLKELQKKFPESMDIRFAIARVYRDEGFQNKALDEYMAIATNAQAVGDIDSAIKARSEIKYLKPDDIENLRELAFLYEQKGDYSQAISEYRSMLRYDINNMAALEGLGRVALKIKDYGNARSAYKKLIKMDPENPEYNLSYGLVLMNMKRKQEALEHLKKAGDIFYDMEEWEKAKEAYEALVMIDPKNSEYRAKLNEVILKLEEMKKSEKEATIEEAEVIALEGAESQEEQVERMEEQPSSGFTPLENSLVEQRPQAGRGSFFKPKEDLLKKGFSEQGGFQRRGAFQPKASFLKKGFGEPTQGKPTLSQKPILVRGGGKPLLGASKPLLTKEPLPSRDKPLMTPMR